MSQSKRREHSSPDSETLPRPKAARRSAADISISSLMRQDSGLTGLPPQETQADRHSKDTDSKDAVQHQADRPGPAVQPSDAQHEDNQASAEIRPVSALDAFAQYIDEWVGSSEDVGHLNKLKNAADDIEKRQRVTDFIEYCKAQETSLRIYNTRNKSRRDAERKVIGCYVRARTIHSFREHICLYSDTPGRPGASRHFQYHKDSNTNNSLRNMLKSAMNAFRNSITQLDELAQMSTDQTAEMMSKLHKANIDSDHHDNFLKFFGDFMAKDDASKGPSQASSS